jgi:hypothetical protein
MKFTKIYVKPFVYISSSGDYFVDVLYKENAKPENGARFCRRFHLNAERFMTNDNQPGYIQMPKYVTDEVLRQVRQLVEADELKPYEYDRDGYKRWNDLRYYERDVILKHSQEWPITT